MSSLAAWQNSSNEIPVKYRSEAQSPRPSSGGKRNWPDQPQTPDKNPPPRIWEDKGTTEERPVITSRRASFLKFLNDHPNVAAKRSQRLANSTTTTTTTSTTTNSTNSTNSTTTQPSTATQFHPPVINTGVGQTSVDHPSVGQPYDTEYDLNTTTQLFKAMDVNHDGRIDWHEFLGYLNQSEGRAPIVQTSSRRSSLGMGLNATTKVQRRLALRRFFNELDVDHDGSVSSQELRQGLQSNAGIRSMFDATALRGLTVHTRSGTSR
jgi:hypothetical protein